MIAHKLRAGVAGALTLAALLASSGEAARAAADTVGRCEARQTVKLVPTDPALCASLLPKVQDPSGLPLEEYEDTLNSFFRAFCHRDTANGWVRDKWVRDTGPYISRHDDGTWTGQDYGTHSPVVIWYSPDMAEWARKNRTPAEEDRSTDKTPVPDGAIMVKEMYPAPASRCADVDPDYLLPSSGAAIMVRDADASQDGWFWGWFGWSGWDNDYPASNDSNRSPYMGFGQYCVNCHASARDNMTFTSTRNMQGEKGRPLVFLTQDDAPRTSAMAHHAQVVLPGDDAPRLGQPHVAYTAAFNAAFPNGMGGGKPTWDTLAGIEMPSETYDNVWMPAGTPTAHGEFITSDQCAGCHDAGSTGLQFDMTRIDPATDKLWNHSPYATWRTSPMGLAGRDPIFFSQLASESQTFHPDAAGVVENTCLGCHGFMGQRQYGIDQSVSNDDGDCGTFRRDMANAIPLGTTPGTPEALAANYGGLARDGISCMACHRMVLGEEAEAAVKDQPQNNCVEARQEFLNPNESGFAKTFTGSYMVSAPDEVYGPFKDPKTAPMEAALGITPKYSHTLGESETCGTCHTVHLPVLHEGKPVGYIYEQLTYPEWAFSAYRTGTGVDGPLPHGAGERQESCQDCHMPSTEPDGTPTVSKIASIQEYTNFPQAEFTKTPDEIDLPEREGFARHTLVGLNIFLVKMAQQFPDVLGIRTQDPMLTSKGVDPLLFTEQQMLDQAANDVAEVTVGAAEIDGNTLTASVSVLNKVGHKFPSGVGFRRAFLTFEVLDPLGDVIWASGRTDATGRLLDADGSVLPGEMWWDDSCTARIEPGKRIHQPHYQTITAQNQVQVYQELVSTPPTDGSTDFKCGEGAAPEGQLTTSFLSICAEVKDNRLMPHGTLPLKDRIEIAKALGAQEDMAHDTGATAVGDDPDYVSGGGDSLVYRVDLSEVKGTPDTVRARLYYQATPPFYLQDRFCTAKGADRDRLYFLSGHLNLDGTEAEGWKLAIADSGATPIAK
ncbi:hypothetical protein [Caenispirillum salinarum]|uniref:hypothetical protein n=1 Tax=Caenispirillum salinarum TaxID=859058 RepID=UPI00384D21F6